MEDLVTDDGGSRRILITGNMGYLGPRVVHHLRRAFPGAELIGIDSGWFGSLLTDRNFLPEALLDQQLFCDLRDFPDEALEDVDAVVHLAGISNDPIGNRFESVTIDINLKATVELAKRARRKGVTSFVFASSCSVYGLAETEPRTEQSEVNPLTAYARSKVQSEKELARLATEGFRVTCLRFATACGWSERLRLDLVLNDFVASAVAGGKILILSDGTPWRPLIDVNDMARAIEWAIGRPRESGGDCLVVNVGADSANYTVRELAETVVAEIPDSSYEIAPDAQPDKRSYRTDFSLFRALAPDHQPRWSLRDSIRALHDGLKRIGYDIQDVRQSPYIRLRTLIALLESGLLSDDLRWTIGEPLYPGSSGRFD